jgi:hypothetical protein
MNKKKGVVIDIANSTCEALSKFWRLASKYYNTSELEGIAFKMHGKLKYMIAFRSAKNTEEMLLQDITELLNETKAEIDSNAEYMIVIIPLYGWEQENKMRDKSFGSLDSSLDKIDFEYRVDRVNKRTITHLKNSKGNVY